MDNLEQKVDKILEKQNIMQKNMLGIQNSEINIISTQKDMLKTQFEMQNNINKMQNNICEMQNNINKMQHSIKKLDTKIDAQYKELNSKIDTQYSKIDKKLEANIYDISEMFRDLYKHIDKDTYKENDRNLKLLKKNNIGSTSGYKLYLIIYNLKILIKRLISIFLLYRKVILPCCRAGLVPAQYYKTLPNNKLLLFFCYIY